MKKTKFDFEVKATKTDMLGEALGLTLEDSKILFDRFVGVVKYYLENDDNPELADMLYAITALGNTQAEAVMLAYGFGKMHEIELLFFTNLEPPLVTPPETNPWMDKPLSGETLRGACRIGEGRIDEIVNKSTDIVGLIKEERTTKESDQILSLMHTCKDMNELLFMSYSYGYVNRSTISNILNL
jgi:hypothetical protein